MWRFLWRSIDRFSLHYFKYVIHELRSISVVDKHNKEVVVDLLQSVVEIVTYGESHDPSIFECFMEFQVLAEFVRLLNIAGNSGIEVPLLQYLSIMIQNMDNEHSIYYCLSNGYVNSIIKHQFKFDGGDLVPYYISFLRAVSAKVDRDTICLLIEVHQDAVVSLPLYAEALKFAHHGEKMIQIAVRAIILNVYNAADDMVSQCVTAPPVSEYFSSLVISLRKKCFKIDALVNGKMGTCQERKRELIFQTDGIDDDLYYLKDILCIGDQRLSSFVTHNMVDVLILPIFLPHLHLTQSNGTCLSAVTSLYVLSRLLQVFDGTDLVNSLSSAVLFSFTPSQLNWVNAFDVDHNETEEIVHLQPKWDETFMRNHLLGHACGSVEFGSSFAGLSLEITQNKWGGILHYIFSSNYCLVLASLMLLFVVAETKDVDHLLEAMINQIKTAAQVHGSTFGRNIKKIVDALLTVLTNEPSGPVPIIFHTAWFLRKLLVFFNTKLDDYEFELFKTSYDISYGRLCEEFSGCWCDYIPETLRNEWVKCKTALEESSKSKDPFFILDFAWNQMSANIVDSACKWQQMADAVKVFTIHLQLRPFILGDGHIDNPFEKLKTSSLRVSGKRYASDLSSASFGSEVALGLAIPCTIAFSEAGTRDIYVIPIAKEASGKLLLVEQHPLHSRKGVVIAIAPLAGLNACQSHSGENLRSVDMIWLLQDEILNESDSDDSIRCFSASIWSFHEPTCPGMTFVLHFAGNNVIPKIDENHPTWLHLQLREFDPSFDVSDTRSLGSKATIPAAKGRWILGFSNAAYCNAAYSAILEETRKQRSSIESLVGTLLLKNSFGNLSHG